jgi:hypothetical protein
MGKIIWAADPVEFAEGYDPAWALYQSALQEAGVNLAFKGAAAPLLPAVLVFPTVLDDAELYSFSNESLDPQKVDIIDVLTGAHIQFQMESQRGAALLLDRQGKVLASYGGAAVAAQ